MKPVPVLLRIFFTVIFLVLLLHFVSPEKISGAIIKCDLRWMVAAISLMPLFFAARIGKWFLLVRQIDDNVTLVQIVPGYLRGMALGLITPGRLGELARIQGMKKPGKCAGLFFIEKVIEVGCLLILCLAAIIAMNLLTGWITALLTALLIICALVWRKILTISIRLFGQKFGWPSHEKLEEIEWAITNLKIGGNIFLSTACFILFTIQIYMVLSGMETPGDPLVILLIPLVLLTNLLPITVGGYGIREAAAVFLFKFKHIEAGVAAGSVGLAVFFNLVIPSLIGAGIHIFRSRTTVK